MEARIGAITDRIFPSLSEIDLRSRLPLTTYNRTWSINSVRRSAVCRGRPEYQPSATEYTQSSRLGLKVRSQRYDAP